MMGGSAMRASPVRPVLKSVEKTRTLFPETWLWLDTLVGYVSYCIIGICILDDLDSSVGLFFKWRHPSIINAVTMFISYLQVLPHHIGLLVMVDIVVL